MTAEEALRLAPYGVVGVYAALAAAMESWHHLLAAAIMAVLVLAGEVAWGFATARSGRATEGVHDRALSREQPGWQPAPGALSGPWHRGKQDREADLPAPPPGVRPPRTTP